MLNNFNSPYCSFGYKSQISDTDSVSFFRWNLRKGIYNTLDKLVNLLLYPGLVFGLLFI
jgi:hypothetical protein